MQYISKIEVFYCREIDLFESFCLISGWKFVPSRFVPPPKEFRIFGNVSRQTVMENFTVPLDVLKRGKRRKSYMYQSRITKYFKPI